MIREPGTFAYHQVGDRLEILLMNHDPARIQPTMTLPPELWERVFLRLPPVQIVALRAVLFSFDLSGRCRIDLRWVLLGESQLSRCNRWVARSAVFD